MRAVKSPLKTAAAGALVPLQRIAFRSLAPRTQARNIMRTAALTVPPPQSVFSPQLPAKRGTPHPGNSKARRVSQPCPANAGKGYHAHSASFRPADRIAFSPYPTFRKAPERLTPEIPKRIAFRSLLPQTQARNIMRTAALSVPPPQSVFSQLSAKRRSRPAPRRRFPGAEAAPGGAILESFFPNALECTLKAHSKQKRR